MGYAVSSYSEKPWRRRKLNRQQNLNLEGTALVVLAALLVVLQYLPVYGREFSSFSLLSGFRALLHIRPTYSLFHHFLGRSGETGVQSTRYVSGLCTGVYGRHCDVARKPPAKQHDSVAKLSIVSRICLVAAAGSDRALLRHGVSRDMAIENARLRLICLRTLILLMVGHGKPAVHLCPTENYLCLRRELLKYCFSAFLIHVRFVWLLSRGK